MTSPRPASTWRSRQLAAALRVPPSNQRAREASLQSRAVVQGVSQSRSWAAVSQYSTMSSSVVMTLWSSRVTGAAGSRCYSLGLWGVAACSVEDILCHLLCVWRCIWCRTVGRAGLFRGIPHVQFFVGGWDTPCLNCFNAARWPAVLVHCRPPCGAR